MIELITAVSAAFSAFHAHNFAEKFLVKKRGQSVSLVVRGYHIHHSFFGVIFIALALFFITSFYALILFGYGLGNIVQHKYTHNQAGEKGMVFITKTMV